MRKILFLLVLIGQHAVAQQTILWSVEHPDTEHRSYLLGTFHQMGNSFVDSLPEIARALAESELAIFESIDQKEVLIAYLNSREDDPSYRTHLKPRNLAKLDELAESWPIKPEKLKPMELLTKLRQAYTITHCRSVLATDTFDHMDNYILHLAEQKGLRTMGLETDSLQTEFIGRMVDDGSWERLAKPINEAVIDLTTGRGNRRRCSFNLQYRCLSFNYQFDVVCGESELLKGRNTQWMEVLPDLLQEQRCFMVSGLLHLFGDCGLIMQLRALGYVVEPVPMEASRSHCPTTKISGPGRSH